MKPRAGAASMRPAPRIERSRRQASAANAVRETRKGTHIAGRVPTPRKTPMAISVAAVSSRFQDGDGRRSAHTSRRTRPTVMKVNAAATGMSLLLNIA